MKSLWTQLRDLGNLSANSDAATILKLSIFIGLV